MAKLVVLTIPDHRLRLKAKPVDRVTDETRQILDDMLETMYAEEGIGLAATQVNVQQRLVVIDMQDRDNSAPAIYKMVNPEIVWASQESSICKEGCLSVPEYRAEVKRSQKIRVQYLDENGNAQTLEAEGLLATCIQHELDHLDGKLFIDHLTPLKRAMALKKAEKRERLTVSP